MQTSYLKIVDGRARYAGASEFRTFLFGVIRHTASEDRRRRAMRAVASFGFFNREHDDHVEATGLTPIIRDETSRELIAALGQLSVRQRDVLHLVFYQELTIAAAAEILGISVGSARAHYERGKARIRRILGENGSNAE